jgi:hypothetical protein
VAVDTSLIDEMLLGLETIVRLKGGSTAPKDRLVVPILEETLRKSRG